MQLVKARNLPAVDTAMFGSATSDPFAILNVIGASAKSNVKKANLNPVWNEEFVLPIDDPSTFLTV